MARHWVIDAKSGYHGAADDFPPAHWPNWLTYRSAVEQKRTCEDIEMIPETLRAVVTEMQSPAWLGWLKRQTGISELQTDPTLRGGGLHQSGAGDFLDIHLDYKIHPTLLLERRLNAILFLNREWDESWGGALELWDAGARECVHRIFPKFRRLVLFECTDDSYHGMPEPLACPLGVTRNTVAVYYLSPPQGRRRALFVPRRLKAEPVAG